MIYRHPKITHTQEVKESETVKRRLLEKAGWTLVEALGVPQVKDSTTEPKPIISDGDKPDEKRKDEAVMPAHLPSVGQPPARNVAPKTEKKAQ